MPDIREDDAGVKTRQADAVVDGPWGAGQTSTQTIRSVLASDGFYLGTAVGVSMLPLIREGVDVIEVASCDASRLRPMDVVLYEVPGDGACGGTYVLHRVVGRDGGAVVTLGDNCVSTERIDPAWVLGVLVGLYRNAGEANALGTPAYRAYVALRCRPWTLRVLLVGGWRRARHRAGALLRRLRLR